MAERVSWTVIEQIDYTIEARMNGQSHRPSQWCDDLTEVQNELKWFASMNRSAEWLIIRRVRSSIETPISGPAVLGVGGDGEQG